jgi:hypothetical protein
MVTILNAPAPKKNIWGRLGAAASQGLEEGFERSRMAEAEALKHERTLELQGNLRSQKAQELAGKKQRQQISQDIATRMLRGEQVSPEEESFLLQEHPQAYKTLNPKEPKKTQASQPIDPEQLERIEKVRANANYDEMDEVDQYRALTKAGVSKENAAEEAKLTGSKLERLQKGVESAYKAQENFINDTTKAYRSFETDTKPKLLQMQKLASDDQLIGPTASAFMDTLGIPLGTLEDPSSELYTKLSLDLLKGLPETFGNRIMKVEVDNFLKTIPTLLNSPSGRRMIASNMLKLGEMKEVFYNEMRNQQKHYLDKNKPLPRDFQQNVFDQVKPQINRINDEFVKLSDIKFIPDGTVPFFNPFGDIEFVPKPKIEWAKQNGGKEVW